MAALPAPPAPVPDEAVEEPAGAVEAAPPPVVEPEVFFRFSFVSVSHVFTYFLFGIFYTSECSSPFCLLVATCLLGCYFSICQTFFPLCKRGESALWRGRLVVCNAFTCA